jgi:Carbohydrate-selective porin, OprB family
LHQLLTSKNKQVLFSINCGSIFAMVKDQNLQKLSIIFSMFKSISVLIVTASCTATILFLGMAGRSALAQEKLLAVEEARLNLEVSATNSLMTADSLFPGLDTIETSAIAQAPDQPTAPGTKPEDKPTEGKPAPTSNQFSSTTKLQGQVIFGLTSGLSGDISRNAAFGQRTRLELVTNLGTGTLTTRLQIDGMGTPNSTVPAGTIDTPEGGSSFGVSSPSGQVNLDLLKYEMPIGENTQLVVAANAAGADDFTDSINPYFDGDGASGSISRFGNRPSIYYLVSGAGAGIRHKFSPTVEGSLGYLTSNAANPAVGSGLAGGSYGAIAQLTFTPNENTKIGLTYVNSRNTTPGTGSNNANPNGSNNMIGVQGSFKLSPGLALGGWVGYNKNSDPAGDRDIMNWAVTAAFPDLGGAGNLGGLIIGQEPRVTGVTGTAVADTGSSLHIEGFYQVRLSENLSITPGLIYLTAPDHNSANGGALIGTVRTTFSF